MRPERNASDRRLAGALVAGQLALVAAVALTPRRADWPTPAPLRVAALLGQGAGLALALAGMRGLGSSLTASPLPRADAELRTDGVYGVVRHPIYAGLLIAVAARTAGTGNRAALLPAVALGVLLHVKAGVEERHLTLTYPGYEHYAQHTGRLMPRRAGH